MSLMNAIPLIRVITAGPGFSKDIGAFLDLLQGLPGFVTREIRGTFGVAVQGAGLLGEWWFTGVEPDVLYGFMDTTQLAALASLVTDVNGNAGMVFSFSADTLTGLLSRRTYGDAALAQVIDTVNYNLRMIHETDSTWLVACNTTHDTVAVYINQDGDLAWSMGDSAYTYYLRPESEAICPNWVGPAWLGAVLEPNRR
jgi:hypothetical protein